VYVLFFFQAEDGIRDFHVTGVQTCALPICDEVGRDYDEIIKSTNINILPIDRGDDPERAMARAHVGDPARWRSGWGLVGTEDEIVAKVESVLAAGADYVNFYIPGLAYDLDLLARAEAVVRRC